MMGTQGENKTEKQKMRVRSCSELHKPREPSETRLASRWEASRHFIYLIKGQHANVAIKQVFPFQQLAPTSVSSFVVCQ